MRGVDLYQEQLDVDLTLVRKIALHFKKKLPQHIDLNDLIQSGYVGLLEAKQHFDEAKGVEFSNFASLRIKGAIIDSLRKNSWGTKESLKNMRIMSQAICKLEQSGKRQPTTEEIAKEMGITIEQHDEMVQAILVSNVANTETQELENVSNSNEDNPSQLIIKQQMIEKMKVHIECLSEREQQILSLYYNDEFTLKEIADILSISEARVSQLHSRSIAKLQSLVNQK